MCVYVCAPAWLNLINAVVLRRGTGEDTDPREWSKGRLYLLLHCHRQNDSGIKKGSVESHFNVSLIVRDKVTRHCSVHRPQLLKRD